MMLGDINIGYKGFYISYCGGWANMNNPFEWKSFTDKLREQLPDSNVNSDAPDELDFSWIQQYVEDTVEQSLAHSFKKKSTNRTATPAGTDMRLSQVRPKWSHPRSAIARRL